MGLQNHLVPLQIAPFLLRKTNFQRNRETVLEDERRREDDLRDLGLWVPHLEERYHVPVADLEALVGFHFLELPEADALGGLCCLGSELEGRVDEVDGNVVLILRLENPLILDLLFELHVEVELHFGPVDELYRRSESQDFSRFFEGHLGN